jgi:murein DD-endopeptidase MepM/ murein hydrolase activator NlpD
MKQLRILLLSLIIVSCATTEVTETPPVVNTKIITTNTPLPLTPTSANTEIIPTSTSSAPIATPSIIPTTTFTSEAPCDPFSTDYCITDGHFFLQRPIQPPANDLIDPTYRYGSTANGTREPHHGVEFSNPSGTPVHAAADGTVIFAGPDQPAIYAPWGNFYGNLVVIEHGNDLFTLYAHLSRIDVGVNQKVLAGEKIGEVGRTGGAIGSHLHFEVRRGDVKNYFSTQNPELWLIPAKDANGGFFGTFMISVVDAEGKLVEHAKFTLGYYSEPSQSPIKIYYAAPYSPDMLNGEESVALGGLVAGQYRIAVEMNGQILERWVEVQSGKLTQVVFVVK